MKRFDFEDNIDSNRLRVAHVMPQLDMGGMQQLLVEFGRHADRSRFSLQFVLLAGRGDLADNIESLGWPVSHLEMGQGFRPSFIFRLFKLFRDARTDVLHTHNNKALIYAAPAARMAGIRRVIHTRYGQNLSCSKRERILIRSILPFASRLVAVSKDSARLAMESGISKTKVMHIWNGIDLDQFPFSGAVGGGPVVMVSRLSPEKNTQALIRAAAILKGKEIEVTLEIAGDGPCRDTLEELSVELGLSDRAKFLGQLRPVQELLKRASVFVLPSLTEGVSLALLEAMAIGLPVVATNVGGNPEVVDDRNTGILVPPGDPDALADAILDIISDRARQRRMGIAARERVETLFSATRMVSEYERLYVSDLTSRDASVISAANSANH